MSLPVPKMNGSGGVRPRFCVKHLLAAAHFSRQVGIVEAENREQPLGPFFDGILRDAVACVFASVAAIEALANEILVDQRPNTTKEEIDQANGIIGKINLVLRSANLEKVSRKPGTLGYRMEVVIRLRNLLVHFEPEWFGQPGKHTALSEVLRAEGCVASEFIPDQGLFPYAWAAQENTAFSVRTSIAMVQEVDVRMGLSDRLVKHLARLDP